MKLLRSLAAPAFGLLLLSVCTRADVTLAPLFQDHAVLQRDLAVPVWGQARPGEKVTVAFRGQKETATANKDGRWLVRLKALAASAEPAELVVTGKNTVRVADVLVGEVWLASGQSNMEFYVFEPKSPVYQVQNAAQEVAAAKFPLIRQWRQAWGQGDFPFYFVQLANYRVPTDATNETYAFLREAQTQTLALPATGMAVITDLGEPDNIHPRNKQEVGRRLALLARAQVYGLAGAWSGPVFQSATRENGALRVRFTHAGDGLTAHDKPLAGFVVAGADRKFHPATAKIDRDTLLVSAPGVKEPVAVRYAWANAPEANLYNGAGLPAAPFRSDPW